MKKRSPSRGTAAAAALASIYARPVHPRPVDRWSPIFGPAIFYLFGTSLLFCSVNAATARAQNILNAPVAPPPMRLVSPVEREQLSRETDSKKRLRAALELAETRLRQAEELTTLGRNQAATDELASYQSIVEDALAALRARGPAGKSRDLYKRLELTIRPHAVRLEAIRRATPSEYAVHVKSVFEFTRDARTEALNSFYGETVLRNQAPADGNNASADGGRTPAEPKSAAREESNRP